MSASTLLPRNSMNRGSSPLADQRTYHHNANHLVRELSNLSLLNFENHNDMSNMNENHFQHSQLSSHHDGFLHNEGIIGQHNLLPDDNLYSNNQLIEPPYDNEDTYGDAANSKKSANMTETVPVPSSEHVAEIVGRQGCKIKSLRTQTNTYIKTPVRGAEPVFVVTGRKEDVAQARVQILSAAEHFSSIRAKRNGSGGMNVSSNSGTTSPTSLPLGHITINVCVPYKVVGLVVGPKGATIKRIQQTTSTYIVTPGRDKEPVFEVTGLPDNVEKAREEIEKHIASRTGNDNNSDLQIDDFHAYTLDKGYHDQTNESNQSSSNNYSNYNNHINIVNGHDNLPPLSSLTGVVGAPTMYQHMPPVSATAVHKHLSHVSNCNSVTSLSTTGAVTPHAVGSSIPDYNVLPNYNHFQQHNGSGGFKGTSEYDADEGIATTGSSASVYDPNAFWGDLPFGIQRSNSISVTGPRILPPGEDGPHPRTRRTNSDPLAAAFQRIDAAFSSSSAGSSQGSTSPVTGRRNRSPHNTRNSAAVGSSCYSCGGDVNAALVPCGHNSFCMRCAEEICQREPERRLCPICHQVPHHALMLVR